MKKVVIPLFVALAVLLVLTYIFVFHQSVDPTRAHGTVDIKDSLLSFERSGKIESINVDEGSQVKKGDILARLDSKALDHQIKIQFAQCNAEQALLEQYQNGYLQEELDSAQATVNKTKAEVKLAKITYERHESLLKSKSISRQEFDSAKARYEEALASLSEAQAMLAKLQRGYRQEQVSAQVAKVNACKEQLNFLQYQIDSQGLIKAPFDGTIRTKTHELSDFVGAGETIFALTDESSKKIRIYLSQEQLSLIKLGQTVKVLLNDQSTIDGKISFISPTAMFTPKTVQVEDLRSDLVYEVSVEVADPKRKLFFGQALTVLLQ